MLTQQLQSSELQGTSYAIDVIYSKLSFCGQDINWLSKWTHKLLRKWYLLKLQRMKSSACESSKAC